MGAMAGGTETWWEANVDFKDGKDGKVVRGCRGREGDTCEGQVGVLKQGRKKAKGSNVVGY